MPVYDYLCPDCGPFTMLRPMAEFEAPYPCEECGAAAPRALLVAPAMSSLDPARRAALATNERSANSPTRRSRHPSGCACCSGGASKTLPADAAGPARTQPGRRPWMLGH
ncbi:MAG TPA: FmdB family zinc ribbon protein [Rhodopila sp.]